jgi:predicted DNA-binding transcriptional regulator AlpA
MSAEELGQYLGYTRSTIYSHMTRELWGKIPPPSLRLSTGPIWYVCHVEEWRRGKPIEL